MGDPNRWLEVVWERTVARLPEAPFLTRVRPMGEVADPGFKADLVAVLAAEAGPGHAIVTLGTTEQ